MKSSATQESDTGMILRYARFSRNIFGTGYMTIEKQL